MRRWTIIALTGLFAFCLAVVPGCGQQNGSLPPSTRVEQLKTPTTGTQTTAQPPTSTQTNP